MAKNEHAAFHYTFFSLWIRNWFKQRDEKNQNMLLKKLLFKTIIHFTSIYFKSYCKIPARSNKSIL